MTERPILFSGPMVRALLDGRKTQTRRVIKPQPVLSGDWAEWPHPKRGFGTYSCQFASSVVEAGDRLPYAPADRLWVKETWRGALSFDHLKPADLPVGAVQWEADGSKHFDDFAAGKLRPSIFMPRWASRITLMVTDVRVQRIQDITEEDAKAEGASQSPMPELDEPLSSGGKLYQPNHRDGFRTLWDSLNADRGFSWYANPWVVAIAFTVHQQNIDRMAQS